MSKGQIKRAENNQHFVDLREDFPKITASEIAEKLWCARASIYKWCSNKKYGITPPKWTVEAIAAWREELEAEKAVRRGVKPVLEPLPVTAPKAVNAGMFLITVPTEKAAALKSVIALFGGEIVDM